MSSDRHASSCSTKSVPSPRLAQNVRPRARSTRRKMDPLSLGKTARPASAACSARIAPVDGRGWPNETRSPFARSGLLPNETSKSSSKEQMNTSDFIAELRAAPENRLVFVNSHGSPVHPGYHLTELKAVSFQTVDCGGQLNRWNETVAQLWVPEVADAGDYMRSAKFLQIFDKVSAMIPLNLAAEMRVEYGDENFFPSIYHVQSVTRQEGTTRVLLVPPATTCKARGRRINASTPDSQDCRVQAASCC